MMQMRSFGLAALLALLADTAQTQILDENWPTPDGVVNTIAEDTTNHRVFIGGNFNNWGIPVSNITLSDPATDNFNYRIAGTNGTVLTCIPDQEGGWFIGGSFTTVGGQPRDRLARIGADGQVTPFFSSRLMEGEVRTLARKDSVLYIGGTFTSIHDRHYVTPVDHLTGALTESFPTLDGPVKFIDNDGAGGWIIAGDFKHVGGVPRTGLARVNSDGSLHPWAPQVSRDIWLMKCHGEHVYIRLSGEGTVNGEYRIGIAAIHVDNEDLLPLGSRESDCPWISSMGHFDIADSILYVGRVNYIGPERRGTTLMDTLNGELSSMVPPGSWYVNCSLADGAGGWYLGGNFFDLGGAGRHHLARINADGTVHTWHASVEGTVQHLALGDAGLYIAGTFTSVSDQVRNGLALLDTLSGMLLPWDPDPNGIVHRLYAHEGRIYVGGEFTQVGDSLRNALAVFDQTTGALLPLAAQFNGAVRAIARSGSQLFIGGSFTQVNGEPRNRIASLNATSGAITSWDPNCTGSQIWELLTYNNLLFAGGNFSSIGGQSRNRIASLDTISGLAGAFNPAWSGIYRMTLAGNRLYMTGGVYNLLNVRAFDASTDGSTPLWETAAGGTVSSLSVSNGQLFMSGSFTSIGGAWRNGLGAINPYTGKLRPWAPTIFPGEQVVIKVDGNTVYVGDFVQGPPKEPLYAFDRTTGLGLPGIPQIWHDPGNFRGVGWIETNDSLIFISGLFHTVAGQYRDGFAVISKATGLPTSFDPVMSSPGIPAALSDSLVYLVGNFTSANGLPRNGAAAYNFVTGALTDWAPQLVGYPSLLAMRDTTIRLAGPGLKGYVNHARDRLAAINIQTDESTAFAPQMNGAVNAIVARDSTLLAGGAFHLVNGLLRQRFAEIDLASSQATALNVSVSGDVHAMVLQNSKLHIGGAFNVVGSSPRQKLAAIDLGTGAVDPWNPGSNGMVRALHVDGNMLYVGGDFTSLSGSIRNRAGAFNIIDGSLAFWDPNVNGIVRAIASVDTVLLIGGTFDEVGGHARMNTASVNPITAQIQPWDPSLGRFTTQSTTGVYALATAGSQVLTGGSFDQRVFGTRQNIAALDTRTGRPLPFDPGANFEVVTVFYHADSLYVAGGFTQIGGQSRTRFAVLDANSGTPSSTIIEPVGGINCMAADQDHLYLGGQFTAINGQPRSNLAKFDRTTGTLSAWSPSASNTVRAMVLKDGVLYAAGDFLTVNGILRRYMAALSPGSGTLLSWNPNPDWRVLGLSPSNAGVIACGKFTHINGNARRFLAEIDPSGMPTALDLSIDRALNNITTSKAHTFMWGGFGQIDGQTRPRLASITNDTWALTTWMNGVNWSSQVFTMSAQRDRLYLGGVNCVPVGALRRFAVYRLDSLATGVVDTSLCVGDPIAVPFNTFLSFDTGNVFSAWLSDATGDFSSATLIGSLNATTSDIVMAVIPVGIPAGSNYRIRVTASQPAATGADNGIDITISEPTLWFADLDGDGFGDPANTTLACTAPPGFVADDTDCDDQDPLAFPFAPCDDGDPATVNDTWTADCLCQGDLPTGVAMGSGENALRVRPNPAFDMLHLSRPATVQLLDAWGRQVRELHQATSIPLDGLVPGAYLLRSTEGDVVRFVKE